MNKFVFALFSLLFFINYSLAADSEATLDKEFNLKVSVEKVNAWMNSHKGEIREAAGVDLVKDLGNGKIKVRRNSAKGVFVWVAQETVEKKGDKYIHKSVLVESVSGGIEFSTSEIVLSPSRKGTNVSITSSAGINNPDVNSNQMRIDMNVHLNKVKRLFEKYAE
jgi:hypothetical protein